MGLDIRAYRRLAFAPPSAWAGFVDDEGGFDEDAAWDAGFVALRPSPHFPARAGELSATSLCLRPSPEDQFSFRAGSYGGYNDWRERLALLAGYGRLGEPKSLAGSPREAKRFAAQAAFERGSGGPFFELIAFSDCEGAIGPCASAKLSADFEAWRERARAWADRFERDSIFSGGFVETYENFARAFAFGAEGGAVLFR